MKRAYLTFDDGPSHYTEKLTDFLVEKNIQATYFVHGENMRNAQYFPKIVDAIKKGMVIGNHSLNHDRASDIGFEEQTRQILEAQKLIDEAYNQAGIDKAPRYFRFPHLDRGATNTNVIDFTTVDEKYRDDVQKIFWEGVRLENKNPATNEQIELKHRLQSWLTESGFTKLPTPDVKFPWWCNSELGSAIDLMVTFSTSDWMIIPRHRGNYAPKTINDLLNKIDNDKFLNDTSSANIILLHDDRDKNGEKQDDLLTITKNIVNHMLNSNFTFLKLKET